ncbi:MAG TPA: DUF86 domain-containing protein [Candidatus Hydrogenedentes bacterium]|nr:DUF86 domain-containing protein [Candidatus Hydrogenedentota bacterium]
MRDIASCLKDILGAIEAIDAFIANMDFDAFIRDNKTKSAVIAQLAMMGEAAKMIPQSVRTAHPDVSWKNMSGMRDRLIHGYFRVDYELVWHTITVVLPIEKRVIERMLEKPTF